MIYPSKDEFEKLAATADLIPVWAELTADLETPVSAFLKLAGSGPAYLLESVEGGEKAGRYSFLGFGPEKVVSLRGNEITVSAPGAPDEKMTTAQPMQKLLEMVSSRRLPAVSDLPPFCGGAVGYLSYDCVRHFERLPGGDVDPLGAPDALFMLASRHLVFDRVANRLRVVANASVNGSPAKAYEAAARAVREMLIALGGPARTQALSPLDPGETPEIVPSVGEADYRERVSRCLEHIRKGDILQAVLSMRLGLKLDADPLRVYRALRVLNPSPYMFYLRMGDLHLVGSSPETMVRVEGDRVAMNPIAGTRPRGASPAEDKSLEADLLADSKEAAEHLMLVDLARNDLGRVCRPGTVRVPSFRRVERFSHVMHLVSTVEGELEPGTGLHEVIRAVFPAGTVSGAPKVRAMEIIEEMEGLRRGPYGGLVGYFDHRGNMDSCLTIRTLVARGTDAFIQTGAGIVAASSPEREYQECRQKAEALVRAVAMARGGAR